MLINIWIWQEASTGSFEFELCLQFMLKHVIGHEKVTANVPRATTLDLSVIVH